MQWNVVKNEHELPLHSVTKNFVVQYNLTPSSDRVDSTGTRRVRVTLWPSPCDKVQLVRHVEPYGANLNYGCRNYHTLGKYLYLHRDGYKGMQLCLSRIIETSMGAVLVLHARYTTLITIMTLDMPDNVISVDIVNEDIKRDSILITTTLHHVLNPLTLSPSML